MTIQRVEHVEKQLSAARGELRVAQERQRQAGEALADASGSPHAFDRARRRRDDAAAECERLALHVRALEAERERAVEAAKAARRAAMEAEAAELEADIAALDAKGEAMARAMTPLCHEVEALRGRAMELSTKINRGQLIPVGPEPTRSYQAVCGVLNSLRRSCVFSKASQVAEQQIVLPEQQETDDASQAA